MLNQNYKYSSYINNICVCVLFFDFLIFFFIYLVLPYWAMWSLVIFNPDYDLTQYKSATIFNGNF